MLPNALKLMENILTAAGNDIDAVVASNDGTALGALQAMKAQGLAGIVPISGQDATADGCNSIVKGELTVSILKDIRNLSPLAVETLDKLLKGGTVPGMTNYTMAELTNDPAYQGEVPCLFLRGSAGQRRQRVRPGRQERIPALRRCLSRHPGC